jgi:uncharacterized protein YndB with AHSA1/START domain
MVCPRWVSTLTQPIAIDDVVAYLAAALDLPDDNFQLPTSNSQGAETLSAEDRWEVGSRELGVLSRQDNFQLPTSNSQGSLGAGGGVFEIGGPEVVSYGDMMREYARLRGLRRYLLPVPVLTPRLSGLWLALVTPAQARVGRALVEGLKNTTVVRSTAARETFRIQPMPLRTAIARAIDEGAAMRRKQDSRAVVVDVPPAQAFAPVRRIGGITGWYFANVLWKLRGSLDALLGGVGMGHGRRDPDACAVGETIDGWTVEAYEPDRRLRLSADMKLPGRGWLEFEVTPLDGGERSMIRQTATFDPRGVLGRVYWYAILPIHSVIFHGMLARIARRAVEGAHRDAATA